MKTLKIITLAIAALAAAGSAQAQVATGALSVSGTLVGGCAISQNTVDFGTLTGFLRPGHSLTIPNHNVQVQCSPGMTFPLQMTAGPPQTVLTTGANAGQSVQVDVLPAGCGAGPAAFSVTALSTSGGMNQSIPMCVRLTALGTVPPVGTAVANIPLTIQ